MKRQSLLYTLRFATLLLALALVGCIENDIPYPNITPEITNLQVKGQIGEPTIDIEQRTVAIEVDETVDLERLEVVELETLPASPLTITPTFGPTLNLTSPLFYTLTTFEEQSYLWEVSATQVVERYIEITSQVGDAVFNVPERTVLVYVGKDVAVDDLTINSMKLGPADAVVAPEYSSVHDFTLPVQFTLTYRGKEEVWTVAVMHSLVNVTTDTPNAWAHHAYLGGSFIPTGENPPTFRYRQVGVEAWSTMPSSEVTVTENRFSAKLSGLTPATSYEVQAVAGEEEATPTTFMTEEALQIPYLHFDEWYTGSDNKSWFVGAAGTNWWGSGNPGANTIGSNNPTTPEETFVVEGKAAKLASTTIVGVFASASLFTGDYVRTIGLSGAEITFGKPYTVRPQKLTGYYNYTSGIVNKAKAPYESMMGKSDEGEIYIVLGDWASPVVVNTSTQSFLDRENDPNIIAYGELRLNQSSPSPTQYEPFTITLDYRSLERTPTQIIIVAAASKYGDYFTGSSSSVLYLDEFELLFE